jgi:beta-mannanase
LNNLIWVYSTVSKGRSKSVKPVNFFYPGDKYVDIVGTNVYESENFIIADYSEYKAFNKPLALTECGPHHNKMDGTFDNMKIIKAIKKKYPEIIYWTSWHDWPDHKVSMYSNLNVQELLEDPWVITRSEIDWQLD